MPLRFRFPMRVVQPACALSIIVTTSNELSKPQPAFYALIKFVICPDFVVEERICGIDSKVSANVQCCLNEGGLSEGIK